MDQKLIPLSVPSLRGNELKYLSECIETEWVSSVGPFVTRFETEIASRLQSPHAIACVNGTAALHTSLVASGVGLNDEVIVPTVTFIAPINTVRYCGAQPVFMDCDNFLNLDPEKLSDFLKKECEKKPEGLVNKSSGRVVKAIIPVHVFGHPARMDVIADLAREFGLAVIEDATESLGSFFKKDNRQAGTWGDFSCLSFNGNKIITTGGGGMILTKNEAAAKRIRHLTTQAKEDALYFKHDEVGYNYRMTNLQAAVGVAQLEKLDTFVAIKRKNFAKYREGLAGIAGLSFIDEPDYAVSNFWHYGLIVESQGTKDRDGLMNFLKANQVESRPLWALTHLQKPYQKNQAYRIEKAPGFAARVLNLPCSVSLTDSDIDRVLHLVREYYGKN